MTIQKGEGRGYQDTISGWKKLFEKLESQGRGDEVIACAYWTKVLTEQNLSRAGINATISDADWEDLAHNIEDAWDSFEEEDLEFVADELGLELD